MNTIRRSVAVACTSLALAAHAQQARPADTYNAASGMLARGLNDLAAEEYARFLEANPEHELAKQARYGLGVAQSRLGNHEATIEALEPLLSDQRFQFIVESSLLSARSMLATDDPENATRVLRQVIRRHDDHALIGQAASLYIESLYRADDLSACVRAYDEHESLMTGALRERAAYFAAMAEYKEGNLREAVMRLGRLEGGSTPIAASARLMLARTLQQMGDLEAARSAYRNAKGNGQGVQSIEISLGLAQVLIDLNSLDEASRELGEIPESGLSDDLAARVDLERGRLAVLQGNHAQADRVLRRLISHAPESLTSSVRYWHARAQAGMGQHEEASLTLGRVLNDDSESALRHEIMYQLGLSLGSVGKHAEAVQTLRALAQEVEGQPLGGEALLAAASFAQRAGNADLAQQLSSQAAGELEGEAAIDATYIAAESAYKGGDYNAAVRAFGQLVDELPGNHKFAATSRYRLGMSQIQLGEAAAAARTLEPLFTQSNTDERFLPGLLALADRAFTEERWEDAARWLDRYVSLGSDKPSWDAAALRLGLSLASSGDRRGALTAFHALIDEQQLSPHVSRAWYEIGVIQLSLDEPADAAEAFEQAARSGESAIALNALQQLGSIAQREGDHAKAANYFERAAAIDVNTGGVQLILSQAQALIASGEHRKAAGVLTRLSRQELSSAERVRADALMTLAHAKSDDHAKTIETSQIFAQSEMLDELDPQLASAALYERARALGATGDAQRAESMFTLLVDRYPESVYTPSSRLQIAAIAMVEDRHDDAAKQCSQILKNAGRIDTAIVEQATYRMGVCARELGDHEAAAEILETLASRTPADEVSASAALIAGESLLELGRMSKAAEMFALASESGEESVVPVALLRLGEARIALQQWPRAEEVYERFTEEYSFDERAYLAIFGRAWAIENQGRHDVAIAGYRRVIDQHDGETAARAQFQIGECLYAQKKYEEAVRELLRVDLVYDYPQWSAGALFEAGRCFEELDRETDARAQFQQVIERFGDSQWAELAHRRLSRYQQSTQQGG